ncbi:MAG TPA: aldo/keto reductase, partial [Spirochaetia bacterium]|nr:aldo/keto reductase [Spirochaetia bacterium]
MRSYLKPDPAFYGMPFESDSFNSMPYLYLGRTGCRVSKVGLGTFKFGHPETGDGSFVDQKAAFKMLDRAVELGVTFWDTANRYNASSGNSERVLGQWFRANPEIRRDIVIATKLFGLMDGRTPNHCRLGRINIMEAVHASLERLQCDHIDILFFHLFDPLTPIEESLEAVQELIRRDLIRYLGVHNFTVEQLETYE